MIVGTENECEKKIDSICNYQVNDELKQKIGKQNKRQPEAILKEKYEVELNLLRSEVAVLQKKLEEIENKFIEQGNYLKEKDERILELEKELEICKSNNSKISTVLIL